jgi:hypothetical protein
MNPFILGIIRFVYSMVLAVISIAVLAVVLDLLCALVSGGWTDYTGFARAGTWPIVRGNSHSLSVISSAWHRWHCANDDGQQVSIFPQALGPDSGLR